MLMASDDDLTQKALALAAAEWGGEVREGKVMPIASALSTLVDDGKVSCSVDGVWHVVVAEPKQQERAVKEIGANGLPAYCPMFYKAEKPRRGDVREVKKPMFGSYIFAKCTDTNANFHKITSARGVQRLLRTSDGRMGSIHDDVMVIIRNREAISAREFEDQKYRFGLTGILWDFTPGEVVRVSTGPFAGFNVELTSAVDEQGRIAALVSLLGRATKSTFDARHLEKL
jgi:transcription antitermination factor NusG